MVWIVAQNEVAFVDPVPETHGNEIAVQADPGVRSIVLGKSVIMNMGH